MAPRVREAKGAGSGKVDLHCGHPLASLGALAARRSTLLAMRHIVLPTLGGAAMAHLRAKAADVCGMFAAACEEAGGGPANLGAIEIERNTACHGFHVILLQAGRGAVVTRVGTGIAGVNTALEIGLVHESLLIKK